MWRREFIRYAIVGVVSNALLFVLYLSLTVAGVGHKLAATLVYAVGVAQTFVFNRSWSFRDEGAAHHALGAGDGARAVDRAARHVRRALQLRDPISFGAYCTAISLLQLGRLFLRLRLLSV